MDRLVVRHRVGVWALGIALVGGCALPGGGTSPEDMSASDHRSEARDHVQEAREHGGRYDPEAAVRAQPGPYPREEFGYRRSDSYWDAHAYNPTERHLAHEQQHERHASEHLAAARALERFEESRCGEFPPQTRARCPLLGQVVAAEDVKGGIRLRLADTANVNAAVAHMRCHIAFGRAQGLAGMRACPLYLEGVDVHRVDRGREVELVAGSRSDVRALRRRVREHVPRAEEGSADPGDRSPELRRVPPPSSGAEQE